MLLRYLRCYRTADLQENVKSQQAEAVKAKEELTNALAAMEKLKETFNKERVDRDTEKAGLTKRAEDPKAALKPVEDELTGLKRQINAMKSAVFGKYLLMLFVQFMRSYCLPVWLILNHDRHSHYSSRH